MPRKAEIENNSVAEPSSSDRPAVTPERFARLVRLLRHLAGGTRTRAVLLRWLKLDIRGFYRDLGLLRTVGIEIHLKDGRYALNAPLDNVLNRLPYPDPHLTLGEMQQLTRGRSSLQRKLRERVDHLLA